MFNLLLHTGTVAEQAILANMFLLAAGAYGYGLYRIRTEQANHPWPFWHGCAFYVGLLILAISMLSPINTFNDELFFVHMAQHLLMMLIAAPLVLLGRPIQLALRVIPPRYSRSVLQAVIRPDPIRQVLTTLTLPVAVVVLFNANIGIWHLPRFYQAALENDLVHWIMHTAFLGFGLLFWWPIIDPVPRHHKFKTAETLFTLGASMLIGKILSAIFIFASAVIYPFYSEAEQPWGLEPFTDQQLGGVIMLVGGSFLYGGEVFYIMARALIKAEKPKVTRPGTAFQRSDATHRKDPHGLPEGFVRLDDGQ